MGTLRAPSVPVRVATPAIAPDHPTLKHAWTVPLALVLGLGLSATAGALPEVGALEESLAAAQAASIDAEAERGSH